MRVVVQRVSRARVMVGDETVGAIGAGMLILLGVAQQDQEADLDYLARKVGGLRIFDDEQGRLNRSASEISAEILVVSQFTLLGECAKGRRPSFDRAAEPGKAEDLYNRFVACLRAQGLRVATGRFRAMMAVELINDGPVTFVIDSKGGAGQPG